MVSFNYQSIFHLDPYDKHGSMLTVLKPDHIKGGWLLFPRYKLAFPLNNGDILFFHGNLDLHGTSPFINIGDKEYRIGFVMYI